MKAHIPLKEQQFCETVLKSCHSLAFVIVGRRDGHITGASEGLENLGGPRGTLQVKSNFARIIDSEGHLNSE